MVLVPCPTLPDEDLGGDGVADTGMGEDWLERARKIVVREMEASAGMEGFGDSIIGEEVYSPREWRDR